MFSREKYLRRIAFAEGISLLFLILVAMPMRSLFGYRTLVKNAGALHGVLFLIFSYALITYAIEQKWRVSKISFAIFLSAMPFGFIWLERSILQENENER